MVRRRFLGLLTFAGASGAAALTKAAKYGSERSAVTYKISGFTCITCATGMETLLGRENGVLAVHATYPDGVAVVDFDAHKISETRITDVIESMGFHAQKLNTTNA